MSFDVSPMPTEKWRKFFAEKSYADESYAEIFAEKSYADEKNLLNFSRKIIPIVIGFAHFLKIHIFSDS